MLVLFTQLKHQNKDLRELPKSIQFKKIDFIYLIIKRIYDIP